MVKKKNLEWRNCSEGDLEGVIGTLTDEISGPGTLILLIGEMGAGKSAFARTFLRFISKANGVAGSPTFPLVQEYQADLGYPIYHIDLYRLKSEAELEDSGIAEQIDDPNALVMVEWSNLFPDYFKTYESGKTMRRVVRVQISPGNLETRNYAISILMSSSSGM
jgi:tRNA threonylcarbamoyl adenosine modification protein YjeE